jgi:hypothetical protein
MDLENFLNDKILTQILTKTFVKTFFREYFSKNNHLSGQ